MRETTEIPIENAELKRPEKQVNAAEKRIIEGIRHALETTNFYPDLMLTRPQRQILYRVKKGEDISPMDQEVIGTLTPDDLENYENNRFRRNWLHMALLYIHLTISILSDQPERAQELSMAYQKYLSAINELDSNEPVPEEYAHGVHETLETGLRYLEELGASNGRAAA